MPLLPQEQERAVLPLGPPPHRSRRALRLGQEARFQIVLRPPLVGRRTARRRHGRPPPRLPGPPPHSGHHVRRGAPPPHPGLDPQLDRRRRQRLHRPADDVGDAAVPEGGGRRGRPRRVEGGRQSPDRRQRHGAEECGHGPEGGHVGGRRWWWWWWSDDGGRGRGRKGQGRHPRWHWFWWTRREQEDEGGLEMMQAEIHYSLGLLRVHKR